MMPDIQKIYCVEHTKEWVLAILDVGKIEYFR